MTFGELRAAVFTMYQEKRYSDALALLSREVDNFPDEQVRLTNWQAALYEAVGQPSEALAVMAGYVARGGWYSERMLMDDDFKATRGLPGFADLLATCRERHTAALAATKPELHISVSESVSRGAPALLALHGNPGSTAQAARDWAPAVELGCVVGLAQSSELDAPGMYMWNDWGKAALDVAAHLEALASHPAADPNRVVLGGFSMGGGLAAYLTLKGDAQVKGFVAMGPYVPDMELIKAALGGARERGIRGYILCGESDRVSLEMDKQLYDLMRQHDIPVELELIAGLGHEYPADFKERLERALAFVLA